MFLLESSQQFISYPLAIIYYQHEGTKASNDVHTDVSCSSHQQENSLKVT